MRTPRFLPWVLLFLWSLALTACGGDGKAHPDRIQIDPPGVEVAFGAEATLHAKAVRGTSVDDAGPTVTWTSRDPAKVQVTAHADGSATVKGLAPGPTMVDAHLDDLLATATVTVGPAPLASIGITPPDPSLAAGTTVALTATATFADSTTADVSATATWQSSDPTIATVSPDGHVRGVAVGSTMIEAAKDGISGHVTVTVTDATLVSIAVTPTDPSVPRGRNVQLTATGTFTDNSTQDLSTTVAWSTANGAIATVNGTGLVHGANVGQVAITATSGGVHGATDVTVTSATLVSLAVTPVMPSLPRGRVLQFVATGTYTDTTTQNLSAAVTWTSSNQVIASISNVAGSNGQATGIDIGSSVITASLGNLSDSTVVAVTPAVLSTIQVTPAAPSVVAGRTRPFTATGIYSDTTMLDVTNQVAWSSSDQGIATISNAAGSRGVATGVAPGTATITASLAQIDGSTTLEVTDAELVSIGITPVAPSLPDGLTLQFTATGLFTDASTLDLTDSVTWSSSDPAFAAISNAAGSHGLATAVSPGVTTIRAVSGAIAKTTTLTVTDAQLVSIGVTPADPSVANGRPVQFTAMGTYTDASLVDLTDDVTWSSATDTIARVSNAAGSRGQATTLAVGATAVTATKGLIHGATTLTVTAAELDSIEITPAAPSISSGRELQLTATGIYSDHTTDDLTDSVTWGSADEDVVVVANAGSPGLAHALDPGTAEVTATSGAVVGSLDFEVTDAVLDSIEVTPVDGEVAAGRSQQFIATGIFSDGSNQDLTDQVTWTSSDEEVAVISNDPESIGVAFTAIAGQADITATSGPVSGTVTFTVTAAELDSIEVSEVEGADSVPSGLELNLTATGIYSDQSRLDLTDQVTWSSSDEEVATVSNAVETQGLVHGEGPGQATISAELDGVEGSLDLDVTAAVVQQITIEPQLDEDLPAGLTRSYTASGVFSDQSVQDITTQVTWESSDGEVLAISNAAGSEGLATAMAVGTATITATLDGVSAGKDVSVTPAILQSIEVTPADQTVALGLGPQFTATGLYSDASLVDLTDQVTWSSSDGEVLTISNAEETVGRSTTIAPGSVTVTAELDGIEGTTSLTVTGASLIELQITPALPSVALGRGVQFTATGVFSDSTVADVTDQVLWESSDQTVATISNAAPNRGLATSVAPGQTIIMASVVSGASDQTTLTVTPVALEAITLLPAAPSMPAGRTVQMTATGHYSDDTTADVTTQATWSTGDQAVATVSNAAGTQGRLLGKVQGATTVTAAIDAVSVQAPVVVNAAVLESLAVTPDPGSLPAGRTLQLTATGTFSDGSQTDLTTLVTWTTTTPAVLSVSNVAPVGKVTGLVAGDGAVRATDVATGIFDDDVVTVTAAVLDTIAVTPTPATIAAAGTQQFTAIGTYSDLSTRDLTADAGTMWTSSNANVASVSNAAGSQGLATGVAVGGPVTIQAAQAGKTGGAQLTVAPTPTLTGAPADGATNVLTTASIVGTFSVAMNPATITTQSTAGACSGSIQLSTDNFASCLALGTAAMSGNNTVATVTPIGGFSYGTIYKVRVTTAVTSAAGIPMAATVTQPNGFTTRTDRPCGTGLVISQVFGGGGNNGAAWKADFVELHNPTTAAISLNGTSVQYASSAGTSWQVRTLPNVNVAAGGYYLIQMSTEGANGVSLPNPDSIPGSNIAMSATDGKVVLANQAAAYVNGTSCPAANVIDFVGFGGANCFEGTAGTAVLSASNAAARFNAGCGDGGNNSLDFALLNPPAPRSSMTAAATCACTVNETGITNEMDFCNIQFPASTSAAAGVATENIFTQVYEMNVTEAAGANAAVSCQIGYGATTVNPETTPGSYTWVNAAYNVQAGNNDEYKAQLTVAAAGSYRYTSRCSRDGTNWTYCDLDGAGANVNLIFDLPKLGSLTITP